MHGSASEARYADLHARAMEALLAARLDEAAKLLLEARLAARREGNEALADRAYCTWAAVATEIGASQEAMGELTRILGSSPDLRARCLAAQSLHGLYRATGNLNPAGLYAEIAVRLAEEEGGASGKLASYNRLALVRLAQGRYDESCSLFEKALEIAAGHSLPEAPVALLSSALAYSHALQGNTEAAHDLLDRVEKDRASCAAIYRPSLELNLGFARLELAEPQAAHEHARQALAAAASDAEEAKYALYLLGETASQLGDVAEAEEHFHRLQERYYPELPFLPELLLSISTPPLLNWLG